MAGTKHTSVRSYNLFLDSTIQGGGTYADNGPHEFVDMVDGTPFTSHSIIVSSDSGNTIHFSFDGINDHGSVDGNERLTQDFLRQKRIWFRGTAASPFRFWAW